MEVEFSAKEICGLLGDHMVAAVIGKSNCPKSAIEKLQIALSSYHHLLAERDRRYVPEGNPRLVIDEFGHVRTE